jgi:hypothetical protein
MKTVALVIGLPVVLAFVGLVVVLKLAAALVRLDFVSLALRRR